MIRLLLVAGGLSGALACGGGDDPVADAGDDAIDAGKDGGGVVICPGPFVCWPEDRITGPVGTVELGTGGLDFVEIPAEGLAIIDDIQTSDHLLVHARLSGLEPGNPDDRCDPINPRTRFTAFLVGEDEPLEAACGQTRGYTELGGGTYQFTVDMTGATAFPGVFVGLGNEIDSVELVGMEIRLKVEVIDSSGGYAMDEQLVEVLPAPNWIDAGPM